VYPLMKNFLVRKYSTLDQKSFPRGGVPTRITIIVLRWSNSRQVSPPIGLRTQR